MQQRIKVFSVKEAAKIYENPELIYRQIKEDLPKIITDPPLILPFETPKQCYKKLTALDIHQPNSHLFHIEGYIFDEVEMEVFADVTPGRTPFVTLNDLVELNRATGLTSVFPRMIYSVSRNSAKLELQFIKSISRIICFDIRRGVMEKCPPTIDLIFSGL